MPRVVHFEIMAEDPERAVKFYQNVFGWRVQKWEGPEDYWLVNTGSGDEMGIDGGIGKSRGPALTVNTVDVASVDEISEKILQHGGKVALPKMAVPGVGYLAYFQDSEGIVFGVMERDESAR